MNVVNTNEIGKVPSEWKAKREIKITQAAFQEASDRLNALQEKTASLAAQAALSELLVENISQPSTELDGDKPVTGSWTAYRAKKQEAGLHRIAVVSIAFNRAEYLRKSLDSLKNSYNKLLESKAVGIKYPSFSFFISHDAQVGEPDEGVQAVANDPQFASMFSYWTHTNKDPIEATMDNPGVERREYYYIARHFGFILRRLFDNDTFDAVILIEEDLEVASDCLMMFSYLLPVMEADPSVYAVSAFNDNGKESQVSSNRRVMRSDFFPGLGWMLTRQVWESFHGQWARGYWDEWLRRPDIRLDRVVLRPEMSRSRTFGDVGTSQGEFFSSHLRETYLPTETIEWALQDLAYLRKDDYDADFERLVSNGISLNWSDHPDVNKGIAAYSKLDVGRPILVTYQDLTHFATVAKALGIMDNVKEGVPRTAYRGCVSVYVQGLRILLLPASGLWPRVADANTDTN